jgi:hypothetical protein
LERRFVAAANKNSPIQRYGMPIFGYVDRSAVRRLDRHQFQPFRISGFATKRESAHCRLIPGLSTSCRPTARIRAFVMFRTGAFERN